MIAAQVCVATEEEMDVDELAAYAALAGPVIARTTENDRPVSEKRMMGLIANGSAHRITTSDPATMAIMQESIVLALDA